jgi:23S rRNA (guanosine2251-2'-O)-methyltransferase
MVIYKFHSIEEYLKKGDIQGTLLLSEENHRNQQLSSLAESADVRVRYITRAELNRICWGKKHRGAALLIDNLSIDGSGQRTCRGGLNKKFSEYLDALGEDSALILFLDSITDTGNLGAIIRSADQFGVKLVVIPRRKAAVETEAVIRTSSGASAYVTIVEVANLVQALKECRKYGFWIYGADLFGELLPDIIFPDKSGLVLGSEGSGLSRLVKENCDYLVSIPAAGHVDSFNVSVAAGILMYEITRQQGFYSS